MPKPILERVHFRLITCPVCKIMLCCVNPRMYNYCPECGAHIFPQVKERILISDNNAILKYDSEKMP